MDFTLP